MEQQASKKRLRRTWWFWVLVAVAVVVVLCVGAIVADWAVYRGEIHAGVTVNGVYLRGMTPEEATAALNEFVENTGGTVTLTSAGKTWQVTPADIGRTVGIEAVVKQAMALSRKGNFLDDVAARFSLYRHGQDLPLAIAVDQAKVDALVVRLATELHVTPKDASLSMENGNVKVIEGVNGQDVDVQSLHASLESFFVGLRSGTADVPLIVKEPGVQVVDNEEARQKAELMKSAPVTLTDQGQSYTLTPEQIASWMDFRVDSQGDKPMLVPFISEARMTVFLAELTTKVHRDPVSADLTSTDRVTVTVVPAVDGQDLDPAKTVAALNTTAAKASGRTMAVAVTPIEPDITTAEAKAATFTAQLATFTSTYSSSTNRATNVRITTQYATNVFLAPGEEYNFDKQIGARTTARGYKLAPGIVGPNTLEDVLGGGICQVSTTMFNTVFFAGLDVTERHNHSIYINHYPKGLDATVTAGGKNLRFINDTGHYLWIKGTSTGVTTTISIWGVSDGRKVTYKVGDFYNIKNANPSSVTVKTKDLPKGQTKTSSGQTGKRLKTYRTVTLPNGTVLHNDTFLSIWPAYPTTTLVGTG